MMLTRTLCLVISLSLIPIASQAQTCPTACKPASNGKKGPQTPTVSIGFGSGLSAADIAAFRAGVELWNNVFLATWTDLWFSTNTTGPAQIVIVADPNLPSGAVNDTDAYGNGQIRVAASHLNRSNTSAFLSHVIAHELGHSLGYANNFGLTSGSSCASRTIMFGNISPSGPFLSSIPTCDSNAVAARYGTPPTPVVDPRYDTPGSDPSGGPESPIVLDLGEQGYRFTSAPDGVRFDINNIGETSQVAWTQPESDLAFLALDRDASGSIENGAELFGTATPLPSGRVAGNGFEALSELDVNRDGVINWNDPAWFSLLLWTDRDHDGRSDSGELQPISESTVVALETAYRAVGRKDRFGNEFRYMSHFLLGGGEGVSRHTYYDVFLTTE